LIQQRLTKKRENPGKNSGIASITFVVEISKNKVQLLKPPLITVARSVDWNEANVCWPQLLIPGNLK
jgi:hypothetical protein